MSMTSASLGRTPSTRGRFLAPELYTGGPRAEPPVLGPGALGVTETQRGPQTSDCHRKRPPRHKTTGLVPLESWPVCCELGQPV